MKKIVSLLIILVIITLTSCVNTPKDVDCDVDPNNEACQVVDTCEEGYHLENGGCVINPPICDTGYHLEENTCVLDVLTCDEGYHQEGPSCVVDEVTCDETQIKNNNECFEIKQFCIENQTDPRCVDVVLSCEESGDNTCRYYVAIAKEDDTFEILDSYHKINDARDKMMEQESDDAVVLYVKRTVVAMKYGAVHFKTKEITENTNLAHVDFRYPTYLNGHYNADGIYMGIDKGTTYGMIAGVRFEVLTQNIELIPHIQMDNGYSYFKNQNGELVHVISTGLDYKTHYAMSPMDLAPDFMEEGVRYYSYDNHYFYTDIKLMTDDLNNNVFDNAINSDNPYYNYYQYLSFRSKTNYTAEELNSYINTHTSSGSGLYNTGQDFIDAQEEVFINAAMELSLAIHESGWGSSQIAKDKNNLFGIEAYDHDPYNSARSFDTVQDCIEYHVAYFLGARYFNPKFYVSFGTNLGNKYQGINYKYASDAYWGEKVAKHYYNLDKALGFKDRNSQTIVLLKPEALGYYGSNTDSKIIYDPVTYNYRGLYIPFVLVKEKDGMYALQLPLALNNDLEMDIDEIMGITDIFYVEKEDVIIIN